VWVAVKQPMGRTHVRSGCLQILGQPKIEFGIVTAVAEKSCLCLCCQADLPLQEAYGKDSSVIINPEPSHRQDVLRSALTQHCPPARCS